MQFSVDVILRSLDATMERFERATSARGKVALSKVPEEARALGLCGSVDVTEVADQVRAMRERFRRAVGDDRVLQFIETKDLGDAELRFLDLMVVGQPVGAPRRRETKPSEINAVKRDVLRTIKAQVKPRDYRYHLSDSSQLEEPYRSLYVAIIDHFAALYGEYGAERIPKHLLEQPIEMAAHDLKTIARELYAGLDNPRGSPSDVQDLVTATYGSDRPHREIAGTIARMMFEMLPR